MFDTIGTLVGVATKADMLDKDEKLPRIKQALFADAIATLVGAIFGTSTTTTYVESSAGVGAGARTGLASVVPGLRVLLAICVAPSFTASPGDLLCHHQPVYQKSKKDHTADVCACCVVCREIYFPVR